MRKTFNSTIVSGCVSVFTPPNPAIPSVVINLNDNLPFSMKLIPLGQSVINVAKPCIVIAWILALEKNPKPNNIKKTIKDDYCAVAPSSLTWASLPSWSLSLSQWDRASSPSLSLLIFFPPRERKIWLLPSSLFFCAETRRDQTSFILSSRRAPFSIIYTESSGHSFPFPSLFYLHSNLIPTPCFFYSLL